MSRSSTSGLLWRTELAEPGDHRLDALIGLGVVLGDVALRIIRRELVVHQQEQQHHESLAPTGLELCHQAGQPLDEVVPAPGADQRPAIAVGELRDKVPERVVGRGRHDYPNRRASTIAKRDIPPTTPGTANTDKLSIVTISPNRRGLLPPNHRKLCSQNRCAHAPHPCPMRPPTSARFKVDTHEQVTQTSGTIASQFGRSATVTTVGNESPNTRSTGLWRHTRSPVASTRARISRRVGQ